MRIAALQPGPIPARRPTRPVSARRPKPPALPCRNVVLVENSAAAPRSRLLSLEMRSPTAGGGLLPTAETSTATRIAFNQPPIRLYLTAKTNLRTSTQPVSYDSSFCNLLVAPSSGSSKQNQCKIECSILAFKVVSAPACFWDRGARCFVWRFILGLDEAAAFLEDR